MYSVEKYKKNMQKTQKQWKEFKNKKHNECYDKAYNLVLKALDNGSETVYLGSSWVIGPSDWEYALYLGSLHEFKEFWFLPEGFGDIRIIPKPKWVIKLESVYLQLVKDAICIVCWFRLQGSSSRDYE